MHWIGISGIVWAVRFREVEQFAGRLLHSPGLNPEAELQDVELSDAEQRAALGREAARRMLKERIS